MTPEEKLTRDTLDGQTAVFRCIVCRHEFEQPPGKEGGLFPTCECGHPALFVRFKREGET